MAADMASTEARSARRKAEILWQRHTQPAHPAETAARVEQPRASSDVKTERLRTLRLSKEAADRAAPAARAAAGKRRFPTV
jgi:hypothetical protein